MFGVWWKWLENWVQLGLLIRVSTRDLSSLVVSGYSYLHGCLERVVQKTRNGNYQFLKVLAGPYLLFLLVKAQRVPRFKEKGHGPPFFDGKRIKEFSAIFNLP